MKSYRLIGMAGLCLFVGTSSAQTPPATYGANWALTSRDCTVPADLFIWGHPLAGWTYDTNPDPDSCFPYANGFMNNRLNKVQLAGGGLGVTGFFETFNPVSNFRRPDTGAALGMPGASLGSVFGAVSFNGPAGLPVVKGSSSPSTIARNNANVVAFQTYVYNGSAPSDFPLVIDLTYGIGDYSLAAHPVNMETPGNALMAAVLSIVDGNVIPLTAIANGFNSIQCGAETELQPWDGLPVLQMPDGTPWPPGSILGAVSFESPHGQVNPNVAATIAVVSCADPSRSVRLQPNQQFIIATSMQAPSRGSYSKLGAPAPANGYVDAANTLRVTFSPEAPPQLVQALADSIQPVCTTCGFVPEVLNVAIVVKPGETNGCTPVRGNGTIPVALLGSATFKVKDVRLDDSLHFGALGVGIHKGRPQCSISQVNGDAYDDLVCHFENSPGSWQPGQTAALLTGKLFNGVPIHASATVCVNK